MTTTEPARVRHPGGKDGGGPTELHTLWLPEAFAADLRRLCGRTGETAAAALVRLAARGLKEALTKET